jgi:hypothetical protein
MQAETVKSYWQSLPNARQPGRQAQHEAAKRGHASTSKSQSPIVKEKVRTLPGSSLPANVNLRGGGQPTSKQPKPKPKELVAQPSSSSASAKKRAAEAVPVQEEEEEEEEEEYDEVDEEILDDEVDDETWKAMEKAWKDKYDPMDSWEDVVLRVSRSRAEEGHICISYIDRRQTCFLPGQYPRERARRASPRLSRLVSPPLTHQHAICSQSHVLTCPSLPPPSLLSPSPDDVRLIYPLQVAKKKCPQHLLSFYEAHLRFKDPKRSQSGLSSTGLSARR